VAHPALLPSLNQAKSLRFTIGAVGCLACDAQGYRAKETGGFGPRPPPGRSRPGPAFFRRQGEGGRIQTLGPRMCAPHCLAVQKWGSGATRPQRARHQNATGSRAGGEGAEPLAFFA
jgi:hypothetical protein